MKNDNVLNPVSTVSIRGTTYEVREMVWKDYLRAIKEMTATAFDLFGGGKIGLTELTLNKDKLIQAISGQEQLIEWLLTKATSIPPEVTSELSATDALTVLDLVIEMNIRPELLNAGKKVAGRMGEVFQVKQQLPAQPIASSVPATPSKT